MAYSLFFCGAATAASTTAKTSVSGTVYDAYDNSTGDYVGEYDDAVPVAKATVKLKNKTSTLYTTTTSKSGNYIFKNIPKGSYTLEISYKTYKSFFKNITISNAPLIVKYTFIPDIAIISNYGSSDSDGQLNKMLALKKLSSRVYTISSYGSTDDNRHWMLKYANFILVDMYTIDCAVSSEDIVNSPANKKHMISYVFGIYNDYYLKNILKNWNFVRGTGEKNTPNTVENTYIGSYWQAEVIKDNVVVNENMKNLLSYIFYLMGETKINPTKIGKTPIYPPSMGIYHTNYLNNAGIFGNNPTQEEINKWIIADPGYNSDGSGSLNWMTSELKKWSSKNNSPAKIFKDFENWYNSHKSNIKGSFIVIVSYYPGGSVIDDMIKTYEAQGRAVFNLFDSATDPPVSEFLEELSVGTNGIKPLSRGVVCVTSLYNWSMYYNNLKNNKGATDAFTAMNMAIFKAVNDISKYSYMSNYGPQSEWTYMVTIPQFEGVFGSIPVSYKDSNGNEIPVQAGIDKVVELTNGWARLKEKANKDKKVAIVLYNYPPGKSGLGASFLDVFQSLHDLLARMYDEGYNIGMKKADIPSANKLYTIIAAFGNKGTWAQGLLNSYVKSNYKSLTANKQLVNLTQYIKWFNQLPKKLQNQLVTKWGSGLGKVMVYQNKYLVIPGIVCGNVFITVQPSRGWEEQVTAQDYHSTTLPPHQQYVAFYKWLKDVFKADVMINFGTHGTLEWLPGRSIGLEADDWTFQLSNIPNIYPYITSDPGEGMVAKDRSFALVISHMTPAIVSSSLYGKYVTLQNYITNYENAVKVNATQLISAYQTKILKLAVNDLALDAPKKGQSFKNWINALQDELDDLQNDSITLGLHVLGQGLTGNALIQETVTIASSRTTILNNIKKLLYPSLKMDYYTMLKNSKYQKYVTVIKNKLVSYITKLVNGTSLSSLAAQIKISKKSVLYSNLNFCLTTISQLKNNTEMDSIINALNGGYVKPGLAGDPSYSAVLPTGTSMYSVDSTKMPTEAAWEAAKKIVDKQLVDYYQKHHKFPDTVGLVMWGTELLRTEGISIAEFLYYLGVTPTWSKAGNGDVTGVSLISLSNLTITLDNGKVIHRPRIDVYATAVTSNSDWLKLMNDAVHKVNAAKENTSVNYVKKHYAQQHSLDRIFGLPGAVLEGTGISDYLPNTNKWENSPSVTKDLAEIYLSRISNAWTADKNGNIIVSKNLNTFKYLLKNTDLVTQNIDSTWRLLDSNDYYDWFGGLVLASQYMGGNPDTSVVDIRDKNNIVTRSLSEELNFEVRSMLLNPTYQNALLGSASGWLEYSNKYENLFGFALINNNPDGTSVVSGGTWKLLANNLLGSNLNVNADFKAVGFQNMAGWVIYAAYKGVWSNADSKTITQLANKYIQTVIQYGVTCCHHTCANINFNNFLITSSSLSTAQLQQFAQIMNAATGQTLSVNAANTAGTQNSNSQSGSSGSTAGSVGDDSSFKSNGASSQSQDSAGSSGSKTHEITQQSPNSSSSQSSTPFIAIVGVICLLILVGVGYFRGNS